MPVKREMIFGLFQETSYTAITLNPESFYGQNSGRNWQERNAKLREKHKWAIEKPELDNARRLRGIYLIDPEDMDFKKPLRMQEENWKHQRLPPCLARLARKTSMERPVAKPVISDQNLRVSWKPVNPQECVWKNLYRRKGNTSLQHYNLVHKIIPMLLSNEDTRSKSSSG